MPDFRVAAPRRALPPTSRGSASIRASRSPSPCRA
jgi:hypothetical protein